MYIERHDELAGSTRKSDLPQPPEDGAKQEPHTDGIEKPETIVLGHTPVCRPVLIKDRSELSAEGLRIPGLKVEGLGTCCRTAKVLQQLVIPPEEAAKHDLLAMQVVNHVCCVLVLHAMTAYLTVLDRICRPRLWVYA